MEGLNKKSETNPRVEKWKSIIRDLKSCEVNKTDEEIRDIRELNDRTTRVIESYGLSSPSIAPGIVHLISREEWPDGHAFFSREAGLFIREKHDLKSFRINLIHEMFHHKGVNYLPIPLTEAIVERLTAQAMNVDNEEMSGSEIFSGIYTYNEFRLKLNELLQLIRRKSNLSDMQSFSIFAKAHLTGSVEPLKILDEYFSPGTYEKLCNLDDEPHSFSEFITNLK